VRPLREGKVGIPLNRLDGEAKVRGTFRFLADRLPGDVLHGRLITSPVANGWVHGFQVSEANRVDGLVRIFTPQDDPLLKPFNSAVYMEDQTDLRDERIFTDRPLFVGDIVGAVLARTPQGAAEAALRVRVLCQAMEPVVSIHQALERPFLDSRPGRLEGRISAGEEVHQEECETLSVTVSTPKVHHGAMEPHICLSYMDGPTLVVESPCQMPFAVRYVLSQALGLPMSRVRVIKAPMGGTFGGKQEVILETRCALMTLLTGRPVLLTTSREETINSTRSRAATVGQVHMIARRDGRILSRRIHVICDAGAYASGGHRITMAMGKKAFRLYRIPHQEFLGITVFTNTVPSGPCRGYGSPQIHAITEIAMDLMARRLRMDPAELRLRNLVHPFDPDPTGAPNLGNARVRDCLTRGMEAFRWAERRDELENGKGGRFVQGVGLACASHGNGYFGSPFLDVMGISIRLAEDGSALVSGAFQELGNGTMTAMTQIAAQALSLPVERVFGSEADTHLSPFDVGCVASRVTYVCGSAVLEAARSLKDLMAEAFLRLAGLEGDPSRVRFADGRLELDGTSMTYRDLATRALRELKLELASHGTHHPVDNPASFGVHFAQVEVDTLTGLVRVTDYLACHDVGRAINPKLLRGQILGGVQMGIGMALSEELRYDRSGRPLCGSLSRYHMPNCPDMPDVKVLLVEEGEEGGPFGAKSIGEIATVPVAPAICNAVNMALGTSMTELPFTPERIVSAMNGGNVR